MVYQHFSLFGSLTVAENVWLGLDTALSLEQVKERIGEGKLHKAKDSLISAARELSPTEWGELLKRLKAAGIEVATRDRKSTRLNSSHRL